VLTADLLHRLYVTERLSVEATAAHLGYAPHRVRLALDRPAIVARSCPRGNPGLPEEQLQQLHVAGSTPWPTT
jgi:hypothetical protein